MTRNAINWFEIPVVDIDRAQRFYETLLARSLQRGQAGPQALAVFPYEVGTGVGGMLKQDDAATAPAAGATPDDANSSGGENRATAHNGSFVDSSIAAD